MKARTNVILLALPTIVAGLILIILLNWHLPTRIMVTLKTDRVVFKVGGEDKSTILNSVGLMSIGVEKFESIKLKTERLTPFTHSQDAEASSRPKRNSSGALTVREQPMVIMGKKGRSQSNVTLAGIGGGQQALLLMDSVHAEPSSEVTLESTDDPGFLIVRVEGQQSSGKITAAEPIKLTIDQCETVGINGNINLDKPLTLRAKLLKDSSIEFNGQPSSLVLTITVQTAKVTNLFPQGYIPVTALKFERLDEQSGKVISSLSKSSSCEISYPDYKGKIDKVTISNPDFLSVDYLQNFNIEEITYNSEQKAISLVLQGIADKVTSGSSEYNKDHRLTIYNALWHNYKVVALFAVLCWMAGTTAGLYKFFKEK